MADSTDKIQNLPVECERLEEGFRDLANAVADYLEGRIESIALGQALVAAANALGEPIDGEDRGRV